MPQADTDPSQADIERWLGRLGHAPSRLEPLAGDVSARRYLRAHCAGHNLVVAVYPAALREACVRFQATTRLLAEAGVRPPRILESDCRAGLMLLEDLGERTLYDLRHRDWSALRPCFERAVADASRIAGLDAAAVDSLSPPLDEGLLRRELEQTWRSFLVPRGLVGDRESAAALGTALDELCRGLDREPRAPCHRDFMARNLVPLADGALGVLDHQDLRLGPPFYDLASLLNDSLYPPAELIAELIGPLGEDLAYHRAVAQRTLKIVGTFATFAERGDPRHLVLIPPTLERALESLLRLPETAEIAARLAESWRAVC